MEPKKIILYLTGAALVVPLLLFDEQLSLLLRNQTPAGRWLADLGYWLGHGAVISLGLVAALLAGRKYDRSELIDVFKMGLTSFLLAGLSSQLLKHLIGRPRPRLWAEGISHFGPSLTSGFDSMPSGHTAAVMAVALVISWHYPRMAPAAFLWASLVAAARIAGGSHFPADVLAGVALGLSAGWLVIKYYSLRRDVRPKGARADD